PGGRGPRPVCRGLTGGVSAWPPAARAPTAREREHASDLARLDAQTEGLRADLEALEVDGREVARELTALDAEISIARGRSERARAWIQRSRASIAALAETVTGSASLPTDGEPRSYVDRADALLDRAGDAVAAARRIELSNESILLDGGDRRVHAWILRVGAVGSLFLSEDGEDAGLRGPGAREGWRTDLEDAERAAVRAAVAVARGRRRPALAPVPLSLGDG
ncbi:MAG: DUF3450 family protein, partial [Planctomycetota bacterium]